MKTLLLIFLYFLMCGNMSEIKAQETKLELNRYSMIKASQLSSKTPTAMGSISGNVITRYKKECRIHIIGYQNNYNKTVRLDENGNFFVNNLQPGNYSIEAIITWCEGCPEGAADGFGQMISISTQPDGEQNIIIKAGETAIQDFKAEQ